MELLCKEIISLHWQWW